MRFQKTTEYAIRVMVYLVNYQEKWHSTRQLHKILKIPYKYLGRLMHTLTNAGLLEVLQGKHGGYRLSRQKSSICLYEIIEVIEGLESYNRCILGFEECSAENPCTLHNYWFDHKEGLNEMIHNVCLKDLEGKLNIKF